MRQFVSEISSFEAKRNFQDFAVYLSASFSVSSDRASRSHSYTDLPHARLACSGQRRPVTVFLSFFLFLLLLPPTTRDARISAEKMWVTAFPGNPAAIQNPWPREFSPEYLPNISGTNRRIKVKQNAFERERSIVENLIIFLCVFFSYG